MARVTTYDSKQVVLSIADRRIDSGYADGVFVTVEFEADDWVDKTGTDGEVARSNTNNRNGTAKVKLLMTSLGNNVMSQLRNLDVNSTNGAGVGSFLLQDLSGGMVLRAEHCWIQKRPNVERGREIVEYEWTVRLIDIEGDIHGNEAVD